MKKISFISAFVILMIINLPLYSFFHRGVKKDSAVCLEITGNILNSHDAPSKECYAELITCDGIVDSIVLDEGAHKFRFQLEKNRYYAIRVTKKGYFSKLIQVNTTLPAQSNQLWKFIFKTAMISQKLADSLNTDVLDFPIAIIYYDKKEEAFVYNADYTNNIKREIFRKPNFKALSAARRKESLSENRICIPK